jgi:predicted cupin superfamily sugar epimerase
VGGGRCASSPLSSLSTQSDNKENEQASEIPAEDLASGDAENTGCLISEVVVPGFSFEDHAFLNYRGLVELFRGDEQAKGVEELRSYVKEE